MGAQCFWEIGYFRIVKRQISVVRDGKFLQRIEIPVIRRIKGLKARCFSDRAGAKSGAGPVRHRLIERNTRDSQIEPGQVFGVLPSQERCCPTKGILKGKSHWITGSKGSINIAACFRE